VGWLRKNPFLPIVALLAVATIVVTQLSTSRAVGNYEAQASLADVRSQLSELQTLPWVWAIAPNAPASSAEAAARIAKLNRLLHRRFLQVRAARSGVDFETLHRSIDANVEATEQAANFTTGTAFKGLVAEGMAGASASDLTQVAMLPVLAKNQNDTYDEATRALRRAQDAYTANAQRRSHQANLVSAGAILLLLGAFAWFYCRSVAARRKAEELAEEVKALLADSREEALTDHLTGLPNRRALVAHLGRSLAANDEVLLALFDLDGFKSVNDTLGHPAGDALLRRRAEQLAKVLANRGTAYRLGGDEFCVVAPAGDDAVVEEARTALTEDGPGYEVGASVGVAVLPQDGPTVGAALRVADERLYEDKRRRRQPRLYRRAA